MNKSSLKTFAIEARRELMDNIERKLNILGIGEKEIGGGVSLGSQVDIKGTLYNKGSYDALVRKYHELGYHELIEESAYTWFNRLTALAYMEINGYIDEKIIFSTTSKIEPDIIDQYSDAQFFQNLSEKEKNRIHDLRDNHKLAELYSVLIEEKSEELNEIMPFIFQKKGNYAELLFPRGLLMENSVLVKLRKEMMESKDEEGNVPVELIGWLYQFYNSEKKDEVFEGLKKNKKITKENIPAATQLFTPKWIVKYMVENSLGKLGVESLGVSETLKETWKYYIQSDRDERAEKLKIEDIKILDPAMGSGHMLTYSFDLLFDIYEDLGWGKRDAVLSILKNNIFGLEIDERAGQLASFALMMKGREKFPRLFKVMERLEEEEKFGLKTLTIGESNRIADGTRKLLAENNLKNLEKLIENFHDAKEYGSILKLEKIERETLEDEVGKLKEVYDKIGQISLFGSDMELTESWNMSEDLEKLEKLIAQQEIMTEKFDVVITNPPYMGGKGYTDTLKKYVEKNYKDSKADLFAVFMEQCSDFTKKERYTAMIVMQSWMFLSSFEELRKNIIEKQQIESLLQIGYGVIGIAFGTTAFCLKKTTPTDKKGNYFRMFDKIAQNIQTEDCATLFRKSAKNKEFKYKFDSYKSSEGITEELVSNSEGNLIRFQANQKDFEKIPGSPIAYWVSDREKELYSKGQTLDKIAECKKGLDTGKNEMFLRLWNEVELKKASLEEFNKDLKWFPYNKGGEFRKWYGNREYLINWENEGIMIKNRINLKVAKPTLRNLNFMLKKSFTWGTVSSSDFSARYSPEGALFDNGGCSLFSENLLYDGALINSKIAKKYFDFLAPTLNFQPGSIGKLLYLKNDKKTAIQKLTENLIDISKAEWDSRETSWDFETSPLLGGTSIESAYHSYCNTWRENFYLMHSNEEELNRLFIEIYGLEAEMDEKVDLEDITLLKKEANIIDGELIFNSEEIIKQFLSYGVGCIMGRYSLDKAGLIIANSDDEILLEENKVIIRGKDGELRHEIPNSRFLPDAHGIIPVVKEDIFQNDIVGRIVQFVKSVYGEATLEENLDFIADALGKKKDETSRDVLRKYFRKDFYKDHLQRYKKRPIYWMMNSGKKDAFSALIYLHRYEENSVGRVRADYLIPYQETLDNQRAFYERTVNDEMTTPKDKKDGEKKLKELDAELKELRDYANEVKHIGDQKISLDLDDGVKVNYEKFGKILGKI